MVSSTVISHIPEVDLGSIVPLTARTKRLYSDPDELKKRVDMFLLAYDRQEAETRRRSKEQDVDEDGFIMVKPKFTGASAVSGSQTESKKRKSKGEDGVNDFYRFQLKERKIAEWSETKRQQIKDTARFNEMKNSNKFQL